MVDMSGLAIPRPTKRSKKPGARPGGNKYKDRSRAQESRIAKRLTESTRIPFERVPMSGARKNVGLDGDVRSDGREKEKYARWLLELKNKEVTNAKGTKQVTFELDWLEQIDREAKQDNRLPAFVYQYTNDSRYWVVLELGVFEELLKELKERTN